MKNYPFRQRVSYWFDNLMARGTAMHIAGLFFFAALMIFIIAVLARLTQDGSQFPLVRLVWMSLMRTLDPGTMGGDEGTWPFLILMFAVTMGGIFVVGTLIGIITNGIDEKLSQLRKGRSLVVETNHTVILGWSSQIFSIISELVIANQNQKHACIAILADKNKAEMEDEIRERVGNTGSTRLVCRTGSPIDLTDLEIINPSNARSIIVLPPETENPDVDVIKAILALSRLTEGSRCHIVAEIQDAHNLEAAHLVGGERAIFFQTDELIARITAQTCRQSGISVVYTELLDFEGDEIYFKDEPLLVGKSFGDTLLVYEDSSVLGLQTKNGNIKLNPPMDYIIEPGDRIIVISEDDDTIHLSGDPDIQIEPALISIAEAKMNSPERTLILGWNRRAPIIVNELDSYVPPGSQIQVVADVPVGELEFSCQCSQLSNQTVKFKRGDTTDRRTLDGLDIAGFHHVIVLSYSDRLGMQQADAHTLVTLLHLREISQVQGQHFSIVSEMLDVRNRELAEIARADDFIVSNKLVSLLLSQVSENKALSVVFQDLFDPEGSEIYLRPANDYVRLSVPVNFYTVVEAARRCGQVAIGYRLFAQSGDPEKAYGVVVNPDKQDLVTFSSQDRIIVIAEN